MFGEDEVEEPGFIVDLLNAGFTARDALAWLSSQKADEIADYVDLFDRSPKDRYLMRLARRAHIPFSEAELRWRSTEDLYMEIAADIVEARDNLKKCPDCGMDHDTIRGADGKRKPYAPYKLGRVDCWVNHNIERSNGQLDEGDRKAGIRYTLMAAEPGDEWVDHRTDLEKAADKEAAEALDEAE